MATETTLIIAFINLAYRNLACYKQVPRFRNPQDQYSHRFKE